MKKQQIKVRERKPTQTILPKSVSVAAADGSLRVGVYVRPDRKSAWIGSSTPVAGTRRRKYVGLIVRKDNLEAFKELFATL